MDKQHHDHSHDRETEVVDADDTGMVENERELNQAEIEQALNGNPPPARP